MVVNIALTPPRNLFAWDCFGYHLYLSATVIHDDPFIHDLAWVEEARLKNDAAGTLYMVTSLEDGTRVIKCAIGLAVSWTPWFFMGHGLAWLTGAPMDGYTWPYQVCVAAGVLVYLLLGLLALRAVLVRYFADGTAALALVFVTIGTNLIVQVNTDLTMPHLTLFAIQCGVLYHTMHWYELRRWKNAIALGVLIGMAALIRPTEVIVVLLPMLWGIAGNFFGHVRSVFKNLLQWATIGALIFLVGSIQLLYWKGATGHWMVDPYTNPAEGLDFNSPHTMNFLFSYRKGWLLYTPMMLFALLGLFWLHRHFRAAATGVIALLLLYVYVTSSWTNWWYADSFSARPMVALYGVLSLALAALITELKAHKPWLRWPVFVGMIACVLFNLFQRWQFEHGLIHISRMTEKAYWAVFGQTEKPVDFEDLLMIARTNNGNQPTPDLSRYRKAELRADYKQRIPSDLDTTIIYPDGSERTVYRLGPQALWTPTVRIPYEELTNKDHAWIAAEWYVCLPSTATRLTCSHSFEFQKRNYGAQGFDAADMDVEPGRWDTIRTMYLTPEVRTTKDLLRMFFWLKDTSHVLVDGPVVTVYEPLW